jgi:ferrochelatase
MKTGILLINLGTPDAPRTPEVRRYLREFLSDPLVIDIPAPMRWLLVNGMVAPFRSPKTAKAYEMVWTERGSPLLFHSLDLRDGLRERMTEPVELAMRYGNPSIEAGLANLRAAGCERVLCAPLYPQYAESSTLSSIEAVRKAVTTSGEALQLDFLPPFYENENFLDAFAAVGESVLRDLEPDHVLFSFHGLPERHMRNVDPSGEHCLVRDDCCARIGDTNRDCYRAQCLATTRGLRERLDIDEKDSSVAFQSRLGRTPWIQPFTDQVVKQLAAGGTKRLAIFCPAFVADCLETLEEISIRAAHDFRAAGGEELRLVPSLNASTPWVDGLAAMLRGQIGQAD